MKTLIDPRPAATTGFTVAAPERLGSPGIMSEPAHPHSMARRFAERFALIAFGLYHVPLFLNNYPSLGGGGMSDKGLAISWGHVYAPVGVWVARHILHLAGSMPNGYQGDNGDVGEEFGRLLLSVVVAAVGSLWWTIADRRRPRGRWVGEGLQLLLRYGIALGLMGYAIAKIVPLQFPALEPLSLERRLGELPPMALLWDFMRYSRPYNFFGGFMELAVVVLLCFRRTTTLGALLCLAVMTNVAILNYAYGVPVKLYATMIVASAAVLVLYDFRRLVAVFVKNETALPAPRDTRLLGRIPPAARWTAKLVLVGSVFLSCMMTMGGFTRRQSAKSPGPLDGGWAVTEFSSSPQSSTDSPRWRRLIINEGLVAMRLDTDSLIYCGRTASSTASTLAFTCAGGRKGDMHWTRSGDLLQLSGTVNGASVSARARHLNPADYPLLRRKFRWIED